MRCAIILGAWLALLAPLGAHGGADDLLMIYREARDSDPLLRQAQAARDATAELRPQARSALLPSVDATAATEQLRRNGEDISATRYGIQLTQPLFRYSTLVLQRQVSALVSQAELEFVAAEQELILRVAERYFAVLAAESAVELAQAEQNAILRQLEQAEQRFQVGLVPVTDVEEARARRDLARAALIESRNLRESALETLRELTGRDHNAVLPLPRRIPLHHPDPADMAHWQETAAEGNPRLVAARRAAEASMEAVGIRRGERYPSVDLVASYNHADPAQGIPLAGRSDTYTLGVQLRAPLFQGGRLNSQVREAQHRHTEALERLQALQRSVVRGSADAFRGVESSMLRTRALEQALSSTQRALEAVEAGFRAGTRTTVDVLDAQRERFRAEGEYERATYDHLLSTLRLRQITGLLDVEDLERINRLLGTP